MTVSAGQAAAFERAIGGGGIAIFPTDTLYGIACDPDSAVAARRVYEIKGRPPRKPSAVMFFSVERLLRDLPELDARTRDLIEQLLPGRFTLVVANPERRFAPACADSPERMGLRVPDLAGTSASALGQVGSPVMQTSANRSGGPDVAEFERIDRSILENVDLALDGGRLPGVGSTVIDLSELKSGRWRMLRTPLPADAARVVELIGLPPTP